MDLDLEDRQQIAIGTLGGFFAVALPIIVLLGSVVVAAWLDIVGVHDVHRLVFGWMSSRATDKAGHTIWGVAPWTWQYFVAVLSFYLLYQVAELGAAIFGVFKRALT